MNEKIVTEKIKRPDQHYIFLLDTSCSMSRERINQLNKGLKEAIQMIADYAENSFEDVLIRVIQFNSEAKWVMGCAKEGVHAKDAVNQVVDLTAYGVRDTALAIEECIKGLKSTNFGLRSRKPIIILVTDGESNDKKATKEGIDKLKVVLGGKLGKDKTVRYGIGIGDFSKEEVAYFATKSNMIMVNDKENLDVPCVFDVQDDSKIAETIKNVTKISIEQIWKLTIPFPCLGPIDDDPIIIDPSSDENWSD